MTPWINFSLLILAMGAIWVFQAYQGSAPISSIQPVTPVANQDGPLLKQDDQDLQAHKRGKEGSNHPTQTFGKLNINKASAREFENLPGIGQKLAGAIIQFRDDHGHFEAPEQLKEVKGIGEKRFIAIEKFITIDE